VHRPGEHWTEAYRIIFADNLLEKLARITQKSLVLVEPQQQAENIIKQAFISVD
jgi:hypothetical protein